jgi:hypothetical protein
MDTRGIALSLVTVLACCAAQAEPESVDASSSRPLDAPRFELGALPETTPLAGSAALAEGVRARLWWGRGRLDVGAGADWTASAPPTPLGGSSAGASRPRFALEFRAKAVAKDLRETLLRVQLSGAGALHFRPRGGGLQITYREQF